MKTSNLLKLFTFLAIIAGVNLVWGQTITPPPSSTTSGRFIESNYINVPSSPIFDLSLTNVPSGGTVSRTFEGWFNVCDNESAIMSKHFCNNSNAGFVIQVFQGTLRFFAHDSQNCPGGFINLISSQNTLNDGEWHHFAVTYSASQSGGTTVNMYIDLQLSQTYTSSGFLINDNSNGSVAEPMYVGAYMDTDQDMIKLATSRYDDLRVFDVILPLSEMGKEIGNISGTFNYWEMNFETPGTPNTVVLNSGNLGPNGTHYTSPNQTTPTPALYAISNVELGMLENIEELCTNEPINFEVQYGDGTLADQPLSYTWEILYNGNWTTISGSSYTNTYIPTSAGNYTAKVTTVIAGVPCPEVAELNFTVENCCPAADDTLFTNWTTPITSNTFWDGKIYIPDNTIIQVSNNAILDITTADVVFGECSGIDFIDGAMLRANNAVFRPCAIDGTWRGLKFDSQPEFDHQINECTFKRAQIANYFLRSDDATLTANTFSNCNQSIRSEGVVGFPPVYATFDQPISGNTFIINNLYPDYFDCEDQTPISQDQPIGIFGYGTEFSEVISNNTFVIGNSNPSIVYTGIELNSSAGELTENAITNAHYPINVINSTGEVKIENNEIIHNFDYTNLGSVNADITISGGSGSFTIIKGNELADSDNNETGSSYGIYCTSSSNLIISENSIVGHNTGIQVQFSTGVAINSNTISSVSVAGIFFHEFNDEPLNNYITCNDITLEMLSGFGITLQKTSDNTEVSSNCVKDANIGIWAYQSGATYPALPVIRNNYLYNYNTGIYAFGHSGNIGTTTDPGMNTLWSNNNAAIDINSTDPITVADNFGMFNISFPQVMISSNNPYHATASCGHQIYNMPSQGNLNPLYYCDHDQDVIGELGGGEPGMIAPGISVGIEVMQTTKNQFIKAMQYAKCANVDQNYLNSLLGSSELSASDQAFVWYTFYKANGTFELAQSNLANYFPTNQDLIDLKNALSIELEFLLNGASDNYDFASMVDEVSPNADDYTLVSASKLTGNHLNYSYQQYSFDHPNNSDVKTIRIAENEVQIVAFPNPFKDLVQLQILNGMEESANTIVIHDMLGNIVDIIELNVHSAQVELNLSHLSAGSYYISLQSEEETLAKVKLIKLN